MLGKRLMIIGIIVIFLVMLVIINKNVDAQIKRYQERGWISEAW